MLTSDSAYKRYHKPNTSDKSKWLQGYFTPTKHPEKCLTKINEYRSSWELKFMELCDRSPKIIRWASEPIKIPYYNPVKNLEYCKKNNLDPRDKRNWARANYWTDFWIELLQADGKTKKIFIEIKPKSQTQKPKPINESAGLKEYKRYNREAQTYLVNMAKWDAAKKYFESKGCYFSVFTEDTLRKLGCVI